MNNMNNLSNTMGKQKTRKSIKSATNMFQKMTSIMGATRLLMSMFNMMASMGSILEPFIAIFELLGAVMSAFMTPAMLELTQALVPTYQAIAEFTSQVSTAGGQLEAWNDYWDAEGKEVWGVSGVLEYLIEMIRNRLTEVLSGTSTTTSGFNMETEELDTSYNSLKMSMDWVDYSIPDWSNDFGGGDGDFFDFRLSSSSPTSPEKSKTDSLIVSERNRILQNMITTLKRERAII
jgi:hypothetical protein